MNKNNLFSILWLCLFGANLCFANSPLLQDIRETAPPEETSPLHLKYKSYEWCVRELRMFLEAEELPEAQIRDSIKTIPAGGELLVQMPSRVLQESPDREMIYKISDRRGKLVIQSQARLSQAVVADQEGWHNLILISIPSKISGDLLVDVWDESARQSTQFRLSTNK